MSEINKKKTWIETIQEAKTERTFEFDSGTIVKVCSKTNYTRGPDIDGDGKGDGFIHTVIIQIIKRGFGMTEAETFSLLNLGIQAPCRYVRLLKVTGENVLFQRTGKKRGAYVPRQPKVTSQRIGRTQKIGGVSTEPDRVWYISFNTTICELELVAYLKAKGPPFTEDEWAPPPPDPGGEYGEDDEPGDPPEEDPLGDE